MNIDQGIILTFQYLSELKKGDVFTLEYDGMDTKYYVFEGYNNDRYTAKFHFLSTKVSWDKDKRIIKPGKKTQAEILKRI